MRFVARILIVGLCALAVGAGISAAAPSSAVAEGKTTVVVGGTYDVHGTNRNGSKYTGTAVVSVKGKSVRVNWLINSGQTYKGKGTLKNGRMVVYFGSRYPVIYTVGEDGVLYGKWDRGRASETLIRQ